MKILSGSFICLLALLLAVLLSTVTGQPGYHGLDEPHATWPGQHLSQSSGSTAYTSDEDADTYEPSTSARRNVGNYFEKANQENADDAHWVSVSNEGHRQRLIYKGENTPEASRNMLANVLRKAHLSIKPGQPGSIYLAQPRLYPFSDKTIVHPHAVTGFASALRQAKPAGITQEELSEFLNEHWVKPYEPSYNQLVQHLQSLPSTRAAGPAFHDKEALVKAVQLASIMLRATNMAIYSLSLTFGHNGVFYQPSTLRQTSESLNSYLNELQRKLGSFVDPEAGMDLPTFWERLVQFAPSHLPVPHLQ